MDILLKAELSFYRLINRYPVWALARAGKVEQWQLQRELQKRGISQRLISPDNEELIKALGALKGIDLEGG